MTKGKKPSTAVPDEAMDDWDLWLTNDEVEAFMEVGHVDWEEQSCAQRWFEQLKEWFAVCMLPEDEDMITDEYVEKVDTFFKETSASLVQANSSMIRKKGATTNVSSTALNRRRSTAKGSERDNLDEEINLTNVDTYGALTASLLDARMQEETNDCAENRVKIFYSSMIQFCFAIAVFVLGSFEMDGGQFAAVLATSVSAGVAVIAASYGCLGAIGENEGMLTKFMVADFWLMSLLTAFLYTEIYLMKNATDQCTPSKASLSPNTSEGCDKTKTVHGSLMVLASLQLACVFIGAGLATNVLDSINDRTRLEQKQLFFTYFRVRNYEAKTYLSNAVNLDLPMSQPLDDDVQLVKSQEKSFN